MNFWLALLGNKWLSIIYLSIYHLLITSLSISEWRSFYLLMSFFFYVSWIWYEKGNRVIINKYYWLGFNNEEGDTLSIHDLIFNFNFFSYLSEKIWLDVTLLCLGFSVNVWKRSCLMYLVKRCGSGREKKSYVLRLLAGYSRTRLPVAACVVEVGDPEVRAD